MINTFPIVFENKASKIPVIIKKLMTK